MNILPREEEKDGEVSVMSSNDDTALVERIVGSTLVSLDATFELSISPELGVNNKSSSIDAKVNDPSSLSSSCGQSATAPKHNNVLLTKDGCSSSSTKKPHQQVRFGSVTVAWYTITLGDNPGGIDGPPIALGDLVECQEYASTHAYITETRGAKEEDDDDAPQTARRLDREEREALLLAQHVSSADIARAARMAYYTRLSRVRRSTDVDDDDDEETATHQEEQQDKTAVRKEAVHQEIHRTKKKRAPRRRWSWFGGKRH